MPPSNSLQDAAPWFVQALAQSLDSPAGHVQFFSRYAALCALMSTGPWSLARRIGASQGVFFDAHEPLAVLSGRGLQLAEAVVGAGQFLSEHAKRVRAIAARVVEIEQSVDVRMDALFINTLFVDPSYLQHLELTIDQRFGGEGEAPSSLFQGLGYFLGVELLARQILQACVQRLQSHAAHLLPALEEDEAVSARAPREAWEVADVIELAGELAPRVDTQDIGAWIQEGLEKAWSDHTGFFDRVDLPPPAG